MRNFDRYSRFTMSASALALMTALATPAFAQAQSGTQPTANPDSPVEATPTPTDQASQPSSTNLAADNGQSQGTIVVTGSRIRRPDFSTPNPVISIGADQIQESGTTNLT